MKRLLHDSGYLRTETNVKKYLESLSDAQIKYHYEAIEFTPFPILLSKEYSKRFKHKT